MTYSLHFTFGEEEKLRVVNNDNSYCHNEFPFTMKRERRQKKNMIKIQTNICSASLLSLEHAIITAVFPFSPSKLIFVLLCSIKTYTKEGNNCQRLTCRFPLDYKLSNVRDQNLIFFFHPSPTQSGTEPCSQRVLHTFLK